jgi:hypothetical protein
LVARGGAPLTSNVSQKELVGFSDTGTYLRTNQPAVLQAALTPILARYGFKPSRQAPFTTVPSYAPLPETPAIHFWIEKASDEFLRIYSSHSGIFAIHDGDYLPVLQRLAASLGTDAFEIAVNDGDSICVLETDGIKSRLTGCHSYVLDEIYKRKKGLSLTPGEVYSFRGIQFPYQGLTVDTELIPEVITHDFGHDMDSAISDFEDAVFHQRLPSYYDFYVEPPEAAKKELFGYALKG